MARDRKAAPHRPTSPASSTTPRVVVQDAAVFTGGRGAVGGVLEGTGLYRLLVESVTDYAIFALDARGVILSWNAGAQRIKGYAPEEIIGKHISTFYTAEDLARHRPEALLKIARDEGHVEDLGWRVRKDGSLFWASVVITALHDPTGTLVGFAKVTRDLTERRAAEEALRRSEERFRLIVQSVRDYGIFMLDPDGYIVSWNEGAQRLKGYTADEIIGRHFSSFYTPPDNSSGKPAMELRVATAEGRFEDEGWRVKKDGSLFWANVVITAIRNADGKLIGFGKVTRDLTERRAAEQRAIEDAKRITAVETANKTKSEFLAAMSHELRTPLNAIGGYAELLQVGVAGAPNEKQLSYIERIQTAQQHLLTLINDLLNYSKIEAGQVRYEMAPVALKPLIAKVVMLIEPQARSKGIKLEQPSSDPQAVASADRTKAEQVLLNLVSNAVKFTPVNGRVTVRCGESSSHVYISVEDTGPGIPEDRREEVFEPFVQLGRSLTTPQEGTGLGLAISRDLARAMGGDVELGPRPGGGAIFTFQLRKA